MTDPRPDRGPSIAEIAALAARLRALRNAGAAVDPAERARFLADKDALLARITAAAAHPGEARSTELPDPIELTESHGGDTDPHAVGVRLAALRADLADEPTDCRFGPADEADDLDDTDGWQR